MRVEIVENSGSFDPARTFPPDEDYFDLRENPRAVERITEARQFPPVRNFLTSVNNPDSIFASVSLGILNNLPADAPLEESNEFASMARLVFAELRHNFERSRYEELVAGLKELLERDSGDAVRATLQISKCDFPAQNRSGFCLEVRLAAKGDSAKQAELRWGLGLARLQQALLFRARTLKQQIGA